MHHSIYWLSFSLFLCYLSYINIDPLKSGLLLVLSMGVVMPLLGIASYNWYAYFVCMLFLSGVFVILIYYSSLCNYLHVSHSFGGLVLFFLLIFSTAVYNYNWCLMALNSFYYSSYFGWMVFIVMVLLLFMNIVSLLITGKGALRSF
uniref:NADH dehydrogenase subunit 6 n=1 Tax=Strongyloides papillosus TaxID=174720 RepID=A0A0S3M5L8_STREA|nr:NADH dehydrogenase subunit 6 [Strongyloides papillosus]BAT21183.1 NADH dehydrogenase subunit 6 [Strongyloides papillosus]